MESLKWQLIVNSLERISYRKAVKSVLAGTTISSFMPNRIGEYAGRVLFLKDKNKGNGSVLALFGSLFQIMATLLLGVPFALYFNFNWPFLNPTIMATVIVAFTGILALTYLAVTKEWDILKSISVYIRFLNLIDSIKGISHRLSAQLFGLSLFRFLLYSAQLSVLLFSLTNNLDFFTILTASITTFLLITIIPSFLLADLGVREAVALVVFSQLGINEFTIVASTFAIWLINLAFPAIIGAIIISLQRK